MHHLAKTFRPSALTLTGGLTMSAGALLYLYDQVPRPRNWHMFLWPALILMAIGAVLSAIGVLTTDHED